MAHPERTCASCGIVFLPAPGHVHCIACRIADARRSSPTGKTANLADLNSEPKPSRTMRGPNGGRMFPERTGRPALSSPSPEERRRGAARRRIEDLEDKRRLERELAYLVDEP